MRYPIVQTGMGWVAGPRLVAATANAGGLGILASATMTLDELAAAIAEVRARTTAPFGVNLRTDVADVGDRIALMIETGARVASFAQAPNPALVARCKEAGLFVMPTVGARRHAEKVAEWGVDAVIAQGGEGGGHTGPVPTSLLLPQVVEAVGDRVLVIGAGGFFSGRGLVAALAYGASGIAMGTRFLLSAESRVPDAVKTQYVGTPVTGTVVSTKVDGAPQRVVRTDLVEHLEAQSWVRALPRALRSARQFRRETGTSLGALLKEGRAMKEGNELTWPQVVMAANAPVMTKAALVYGRTDVGVLPTGQVVGLIEQLPAVADIIDAVMAEADRVLQRLELADLRPGAAPRPRPRTCRPVRRDAAGWTPAGGSRRRDGRCSGCSGLLPAERRPGNDGGTRWPRTDGARWWTPTARCPDRPRRPGWPAIPCRSLAPGAARPPAGRAAARAQRSHARQLPTPRGP